MTTFITTFRGVYPRASLGLSAVVISCLLFLMNKGNFNWIIEIESIMVFSIYSLAIFLGQLFLRDIVLKPYVFKGKKLVTIIAGAIFGVGTLITFIL